MKVAIFRGHGVIAPYVIDGYINAFREAEHEVLELRVDKGFNQTHLQYLEEFKPDFAVAYGFVGYIQKGDGFLLRMMNIPLVSLCYDNPFMVLSNKIRDELKEYPQYYHTFIWDEYFLHLFKDYGFKNGYPILLALDPPKFFPTKISTYENAICFVGNMKSVIEKTTGFDPIINKFIDLVIDMKLQQFDIPVLDICSNLFDQKEFEPIFNLYQNNSYDFWRAIYSTIHSTGSGAIRQNILNQIEDVDIHIYGSCNWEKSNLIFHPNVAYGPELAQVYQKYAINLNINSLQLETSVNNRVFDVFASKGFVLSDYRKDMEKVFPDHWKNISYRNLNELGEKGEYYLTHEKERVEIVEDLYHHVLNHHTYKHRADQIVASILPHLKADFLDSVPVKKGTAVNASGKVINIYKAPVSHCPLCGQSELTHKFTFTGHQGFESSFYRCSDCCLVFLNPCPTEEYLDMFYNEIYYNEEHRKKMGWTGDMTAYNPNTSNNCEKRMDLVEKYYTQKLQYPRGRLLDVGCSFGTFLLEASLRYWEVQGIEISDKAAAIAREHLGLPVKTGVFTEEDFENDSFDVVTAWDVLEHVTDPGDLLRNVHRVLKKGGLFVFNTPNINSSSAFYAGKTWRHLDAPLHPVLYDFISIRILLKKYNFTCVNVSSGNEYLGQLQAIASKD